MNNNFIEKIKSMLLQRKGEVDKELTQVEKNDPFMQEFKNDGTRSTDQMEDEVADLEQHVVNEATKNNLTEEKKDISEALQNIKEGDYGICEVCGTKIPEERLKANPTARRCVEHAE